MQSLERQAKRGSGKFKKPRLNNRKRTLGRIKMYNLPMSRKRKNK
jgi:hypothetical protein